MDFRTELAKWGYNKGNSIDVEILINEILPSLFPQQEGSYSEEEVKLLIDFVKDCATNWDCDNDSHKYNTPCRMCEAQKVLEQFKKK
jgi:hypothetical protein